MLSHKALRILSYTPELILWALGLLIIAVYILILIPYYSNGINEYSDYALTIGAYDYYDPEVAQGPDIEDVYGSTPAAVFAFWFGACVAPCLVLPLIALQAFLLLNRWSNFTHRGKALRVFLHIILVIMAMVSVINASKFGAWLEL